MLHNNPLNFAPAHNLAHIDQFSHHHKQQVLIIRHILSPVSNSLGQLPKHILELVQIVDHQ